MGLTDKTNIDIDFIGIGTSKAATTWIAGCLSEHPDICMSDPKETHMFGKKYDVLKKRYAESFKHAQGEKLKGEYTPGYIVIPEAAERIHRHAPNAKLIVCLRDPIDRMTSAYNSAVENGKPMGTLEEYTRTFMSGSAYFKLLQPFLGRFGREHILVLIYDDIKSDPQAFISSIFRFLGGDDSFVPQAVLGRSNVTAKNTMRFPLVSKTLLYLRKKIKKGPAAGVVVYVLKSLGMSGLAQLILKKNTRYGSERVALEKQEMPPELQKDVQGYLRDDIRRLEGLLGRELAEWRTRT